MLERKLSTMQMAWLVVALLCPVGLLNYLDRQMLASMQKSVMQDVPTIISNENWGRMLGQFKWVYAIMSPLGGLIADRFGRRWTICGSLFVWSIITWLTGHVTTYDELLWARSLMGCSESFYIPAALALISDYHLGPTRSRAVGCHQMAIYVGAIVGGFGGYAADNPDIGWRAAFSICGGIGIVYAIPLLLILRDAPRTTATEDAEQPRLGRSLVELVTNISFVLLVLYFTLPAMFGWVVRDWMPRILMDKFDISQGQAGVTATLYFQCASIVGVIVGSALADRLMRTNIRGRILVSAAGSMIMIPAILGIGLADELAIAVGGLSLVGIGWGFFDCNNMPILCQIVQPRLRATGYGVMNLVSISIGGIADWRFGKLRDANTPLSLIFGVFAGIALVSVVLVLCIRPRPIDAPVAPANDKG